MVTVGFFSMEIWKELQKTEDEELKRLATALSVTVMQSRANSTTTNTWMLTNGGNFGHLYMRSQHFLSGMYT